jgi:FkbM family methyltransferase
MTFISYAQNLEDVMLWRALKHIDSGFYIDVGANDPNQDSVTRAFYERGWRGINLEPIPNWFEKLQTKRLRDINLQIAAGKEQGEELFYEIPNTGLSTSNEIIANSHKCELGFEVLERKVTVRSLTELCLHYHSSPIHFLKIDVEGAEKSVLDGLDLLVIRPWIILIESLFPLTQTQNHEEWEPILLAANYDFVYFDGLNRFYVAKEHQELAISFVSPPNTNDEYMLKSEFEAILKIDSLSDELQMLKTDYEAMSTVYKLIIGQQIYGEFLLNQSEVFIQNLKDHIKQLENAVVEESSRTQSLQGECEVLKVKVAEMDRLSHHFTEIIGRNKELEDECEVLKVKVDEINLSSHYWWGVADGLNKELLCVYSSRSWQFTYPLRQLNKFLKYFKQGSKAWLTLAPESRPRRIIRKLSHRLKNFKDTVNNFEDNEFSQEHSHNAIADANLGIAQEFESELHTLGSSPILDVNMSILNLDQLTPRARFIYAELKNLYLKIRA